MVHEHAQGHTKDGGALRERMQAEKADIWGQKRECEGPRVDYSDKCFEEDQPQQQPLELRMAKPLVTCENV